MDEDEDEDEAANVPPPKVTFYAFCVGVVANVAVVIAAGLSQQQQTRVNGRRGNESYPFVTNRPLPPYLLCHGPIWRFVFAFYFNSGNYCTLRSIV